MAKVSTIVFDLGAVLIDWNPRYLYRKIFKTEEAIEFFLSNVCTFRWNEEQDAGRTFEDATMLLLAKFPEYDMEIKAYYSRWVEMLGSEISDTVEIFRELKAKNRFKIYALTNWSAESFPLALERFEFLQWFDGILVSGEEKLKKPDEAIFKLLCLRYGFSPEDSIFIDDNPNNIATAERLGFLTIPFTDPKLCRSLLVDMEVLP